MSTIDYIIDWEDYMTNNKLLDLLRRTDTYRIIANKIIMDKIYFDYITKEETIDGIEYFLRSVKNDLLRCSLKMTEDRLAFARFLVNLIPNLKYSTQTHLVDYMPVE